MQTKKLQPGDVTKDGYFVDTNHCGLPWPVHISGKQLINCVAIYQLIQGRRRFADAYSGELLSEEEVEKRLT